MRIHNKKKLFSFQDLKDFTECRFAVDFDLCALTEPIKKTADSEWSQILFEKDNKFEADYIESLIINGSPTTQITKITDNSSLEERVNLTHDAMSSGSDLIYQAVLHLNDFHGIADLLRKIDGKSRFGNHSYEAIDIKSRTEPTPEHLLQVSLYTFLLGAIQQTTPERMYIVTGDLKEHSFKYSNFSSYFEAILREFKTYVSTTKPKRNTVPIPCSFCDFCKWRDHCNSLWDNSDHISKIGGVTQRQIIALENSGIKTISQLTALDKRNSVRGIRNTTVSNLQTNATLLLKKRKTRQPLFQFKELEQSKGFNRLPKPTAGDLFLDIESAPAFPKRRLEYLFGIHDAKAKAFVEFWAHDHEKEKETFGAVIDFITDRLISNPETYIYHYGSYEETQLKRLSAHYSTRESEVDEILRKSRLVDLFKVTQESIFTSEKSYSLKDMEPFFSPERSGEVRDAASSMVQYEKWRITHDSKLLTQIREYNKDNCENTKLLRDWLLSIKSNKSTWFEDPPFDPEKKLGEEDNNLLILLKRLSETAPAGTQEMRELAGRLTRFHQRASKPEWWEFFHRHNMTEEELIQDANCLGGLKLDEPAEPVKPVHRSNKTKKIWFTYPEQEHKFKIGVKCQFTRKNFRGKGKNLSANFWSMDGPVEIPDLHDLPPKEYFWPEVAIRGEIEDIDFAKKRICISGVSNLWRKKPNDSLLVIPKSLSIIPDSPIPTDLLARSVTNYCDSLIENSGDYKALTRFLLKKGPVIRGRKARSPLLDPELRLDQSVIDLVENLRDSYLAIQGPPGTGKTTLGSKIIVELMRRKYTVGITSNSHKAIHELLDNVKIQAKNKGFKFKGLKKASLGSPDSWYPSDGTVYNLNNTKDSNLGDYIYNTDNFDSLPKHFSLLAGNVFLFCGENLVDSLDFLFVDEAGQVSLGNMVAMGRVARNIVIIGDHMQLSQPVKGTHHGDSGKSTLEFLIQEKDKVPENEGIFLPISYRLNPLICNFISDAVYESRLIPDENNRKQKLDSPLDTTLGIPREGIGFIEASHEGRGQQCEEEGKIVLDLFRQALNSTYTNREGTERDMTISDIIVITPYNAQVNYLKGLLPDKARVGTVDLFQGQEAQVVLISMTTSSKDFLPRNIEFLFSKNRLNVAISRARCLAVIVASSKLMTVPCRSVKEMELVNFLCQVRDYAKTQRIR